MADKKVEHVSVEGGVQEFSAIRGKGKSGTAPKTQNCPEKPAIAKWGTKKNEDK